MPRNPPPAPKRAPPAPPWGVPAELVSAPTAPAAPAPTVSADSAPSDAAERIRASASKGGTLKGLHALFGVDSDTFKRWMDADAGLRRAFDEGKEQEREALHRTIYEQAIFKRDLNAAQFLLKTVHGYKEKEPEESRNSVRIVFNVPAAAPDIKTYTEQVIGGSAVAVPRAPKVLDHG